MTIELFVEPRKVYTWKDFKKEKAPYSIGLDGIIKAPTIRDEKGPYANFDHHSKGDRLSTRSTSEQVHIEINMGLFDTFRKIGIPTANVYLNDPDEDTCLAFWQLKNHELVLDHAEPNINRLVYCEDRLDSTAGAYPFGDIAMRRKMAWIFQPYNEARFKGLIGNMADIGMKSIIESVGARITEHIINGGDEISLEGNYEKIGGGEGWTMVRETGPAARMAMYNDGINAFVSHLGKKENGNDIYVMGRRSVWTPFNIPRIYKLLNKAEGNIISHENCWGVSNTIGGSPRETGSTLNPEKLEEAINKLTMGK